MGDDSWFGAGAKVLDGVTIGAHSIIGTGAVVTKDIPEYSIAVGLPAKVVRDRRAAKTTVEKLTDELRNESRSQFAT